MGDIIGKYDEYINELALFINQTSVDYYLRIGYEFDSLENNYPTAGYIQSFQYIVNKFRQLNVKNVLFVWHASGFQPRNNYNYNDWYPG